MEEDIDLKQIEKLGSLNKQIDIIYLDHKIKNNLYLLKKFYFL